MFTFLLLFIVYIPVVVYWWCYHVVMLVLCRPSRTQICDMVWIESVKEHGTPHSPPYFAFIISQLHIAMTLCFISSVCCISYH